MSNLKKVLLFLGALTLVLTPQYSEAKGLRINSFLCDESDMETGVGFTTKDFHIAVCYTSMKDYYVARPKSGGEGMFLQIQKIIGDASTGEPVSYTAWNGNYAYKVTVYNKLSLNNARGEISVYSGNRRILHQDSNLLALGKYF